MYGNLEHGSNRLVALVYCVELQLYVDAAENDQYHRVHVIDSLIMIGRMMHSQFVV